MLPCDFATAAGKSVMVKESSFQHVRKRLKECCDPSSADIDAKMQLSTGFVENCFTEQQRASHPVLQVTSCRLMSSADNSLRVSIKFFDGKSTVTATCQQRAIVERIISEKWENNYPIIRLTNYDVHKARGDKPFVLFSDYQILTPIADLLLSSSSSSTDKENRNDTIAVSDKAVVKHETRDDAECSTSAVDRDVHIEIGQGQGDSLESSKPIDTNRPSLPVSTARCSSSQNNNNVTGIDILSPYLQKWKICGLVTKKQSLREIKTRAGGDMTIFNFDMADETGISIRITAFNDSARRVFSLISLDQATVKQADKRYNNTGHDYEVNLRADSEIVPCHDRPIIPRPRMSYRFVSISDLGQHVDRLVDLLAIVEQVTIRATGEPQRKRSVKLVDQSAFMTDLTLWGDDVDLIESSMVRCPVSLKSVAVKHYNGGYSVSTSRDTIVIIDPEHSEQLRHWYSTVKPHMALQSVGGEGDFLKEFRVIGIADALQLGRNDQRGEFFTVVARVMSVRSENAIYQACSREGCKKKVVSMDGLFRCEKCNTNNDTFKYVAILSMDIFDFTGEHQVTLFEECVQKMLGHSSEELGRIREESETAYNAVFDRARFQVFNMKIAAKPHLYQDEESVRWTVRDISAVSIDQHEQALLKMLDCMEKE